MILVNTQDIPGKEFKTIGLVYGNTVQSKNAVKDFGAGMKSIVGGELKSYTKMLGEARGIATERMIEQAKELGADAVVCVRFSSSEIIEGAAEILAYGTAVKFI